jgi:hypothetical protein
MFKELNERIKEDPHRISGIEKYNKWNKIFTWMFTEALVIKAKKWKQPKCPSNDKQVNKMCIHKTESNIVWT